MNVELHRLSTRDWWRTIFVGIGSAAMLAGLNVVALSNHISPLPKPLGLAFAETVFGRQLPLPVGLLFHLVWVTFFSVVYVLVWRTTLTLRNALILASVLWVLTVAVFFPIVGWGFLGFAVSPKLIIPATISHLLFAVLLWGLCRLVFGQSIDQRQPQSRAA